MFSDDYLNPFESPRLLLTQASKDIFELRSLSQRYADSCGYKIVTEMDNTTGEVVVYARLLRPIPPAIRLATHRIVCDLKHALDQAVVEAAVLRGRADGKGVYFPIGKSEEDLRREIAARCKNVHPSIIDVVQSYGINETNAPRLYKVLSLAGASKHQHLLAVRPLSALTVRNYDPTQLRSPLKIGGNRWIASKNQVEIMRIGKGGYFRTKPELSMGVFLLDGTPPLDEVADVVLADAAVRVQKIIADLEKSVAK